METVKRMFGFCQYSGGLYYGVPNNTTTALELKKLALAAQGGGDELAELMTVEKWFKKYFLGTPLVS